MNSLLIWANSLCSRNNGLLTWPNSSLIRQLFVYLNSLQDSCFTTSTKPKILHRELYPISIRHVHWKICLKGLDPSVQTSTNVYLWLLLSETLLRLSRCTLPYRSWLNELGFFINKLSWQSFEELIVYIISISIYIKWSAAVFPDL